jgi:hypothetical protein
VLDQFASGCNPKPFLFLVTVNTKASWITGITGSVITSTATTVFMLGTTYYLSRSSIYGKFSQYLKFHLLAKSSNLDTNKERLNIFERKVYRRILGPVYDEEKENWRI